MNFFSEKIEKSIATMETVQESLLKLITDRDLSEELRHNAANMHPIGFIREFMTIGFKAPRQTGKSRFIAKQLLKNPRALCVVDRQELKVQMCWHLRQLDPDVDLNKRILVSRYTRTHLVKEMPLIQDITHIYMDGITSPVIEEEVVNTLMQCGLEKEQAIFINIY